MAKIVLGPNSYILPLEYTALKSDSVIGYAYLRCSTEMQVKDSGSVEAQLAEITRYAAGRNIILVAAYVDAAVSGKFKWKDRPALTALVEKVKKSDVIIAYDISRFGRDAEDTLNFLNKVTDEAVGAKVHSTTMGDMNHQRLLFLIMAGVAEEDRRQISARVKNAMKLKADKGELKCRPRFGERKTAVKGVFEPHPEQMKVIERVLELREHGVSLSEIARKLKSEMPAMGYGKKDWYVTDVSRIIKHHIAP